jgi:hypothetical protein
MREPDNPILEEMLEPIDTASIADHKRLPGNFNDHHLVTLVSGKSYVIRISKKGWTQSDEAIGKFLREGFVAELIGDALGIATPRMHLIDGSLQLFERTYAIQDAVTHGVLLHEAIRDVNEEGKRSLLRAYGEMASRVHEIRVPPFQLFDNTAVFRHKPLMVRCQQAHARELVQDFDGVHIAGRDSSWLHLHKALLHCGEYLNKNVESLKADINRGLQECVNNGVVTEEFARRLAAIIHKEEEVIEAEMARHHLCHGDYHYGNVLVDCHDELGWQVTGLLDFEIAFFGSPIQEFMKAEQLSFGQEGISDFRSEILKGYGPSIDQHAYGVLFLCVLLTSEWGHKKMKALFAEGSDVVPDESLSFLKLW